MTLEYELFFILGFQSVLDTSLNSSFLMLQPFLSGKCLANNKFPPALGVHWSKFVPTLQFTRLKRLATKTMTDKEYTLHGEQYGAVARKTIPSPRVARVRFPDPVSYVC